MLSRLSINNYALIKSLNMQPHAAMNVITGETGAGKSIMLGAVGLLLGNRADTKVLYDQGKKCIIEGEFGIKNYSLHKLFATYDLDYEDETVIRREITPAGKSRAFVNDTPVTLEVLKELGGRLMDIHSQHQTLLVGKVDYQLQLIDAYAQTQALLINYQRQFQAFKEADRHLQALVNNAEKIARESDYNEFLLRELEEARLQEDEQEALEEEQQLLEHAEEIKSNLNNILALLEQNEPNSLAMLREAKGLASQISSYSEALQTLDQRLGETFIELTDLVREIEAQEQMVEVDFGRAEEVRERLSMIYHLQNKHHVADISSLLAIQEKLTEETFLANNLDEQIVKAREEAARCEKEMQQLARQLSRQRQKFSQAFAEEIMGLLQQLGMPDARLQLDWQEKPPSTTGTDDLTINFSANKGVLPAPLTKVASGGELSRLMFCFKYVMADKTALPTMVFDEIDAGISGEIALQMGNMMQKMAANHQVITISHLPQIAARGQAHYFVYKTTDAGKSVSKVRQLSEEERVAEIAKMIGGDRPSVNALKSAEELLAS